MRLEGSCHCGAVKFSVEADSPAPFMRCYCSICRKTAGAGGFAINLGALADTMKVEGKEHLRVYRALIADESGARSQSSGQRNFCGRCGSPLWLWDPTWPELIHPHASAIDTPLPTPPEHVHIYLGSKPAWVEVEGRPEDPHFDKGPTMSLAQWHASHGLASVPDKD